MTPEEKERLLKKAQEAKAKKQAEKTTSSKAKSKEQLEKELAEGKADIKKTKTLPDGTIEITTKDGKKIYAKGKEGQTIYQKDPERPTGDVRSGNVDPEKYKVAICDRIKKGGYTAEQAAKAGWIHSSQIANFKGCENLQVSKTGESEFYELEEEPVDQTTQVTDEEQSTEEEVKKGEWNPLYTRLAKEKAPWWLQDIIGISGAFGDLNRINRYEPWQATPNVHLPGAIYYDPTRELAANSEQANIQTQGLAAFSGPQALSARSSQIQGQALKNAADIMSRYNNLNVGLANELEQNRASILNTASQNQANLDTQLWDKYTIMNQQFDNSKTLARQELRKAFINGITNRAKAQALNSMYDNYYTDPASGGFVEFASTGYKPTAEQDSDYINSIWEKAKQLNPNNPQKMFDTLYSKKAAASDDDRSEYLANQGYS